MIPAEMSFVSFNTPGSPNVLEMARGPVPEPRAGEVLIRVAAAGINRPDIFQRQGHYPAPAGASPVLGLEVAGDIVATGADVPLAAIGKPVCALTNGGGYAEYVTVPAGQVLRLPQGFSMVQAAALPETSFTVWHNLFERGRLAAGKTALIHGGSSGIGTTAIQYAHALGARIIVTAGSAAKCEACLGLGADLAINYREQDFAEAIRTHTAGRGVNVILDMVGAPYLDRNLACLAEDGVLVYIAFLGGAVANSVNLGILQRRRLTLTGSTLRPRNAEVKAGIAAGLRRVIWPLLDAGLATPVIHATYPLANVADAHRALESGRVIGKIVLTVAAG